MTVSVDDPWNIKCVNILLIKLDKLIKDMGPTLKDKLDGQSEAYWRDMIVAKFQRLRTTWRSTRMRSDETDEQWEERMGTKKVEDLRKARQLSRRRTVRIHVCVSDPRTYSRAQKYGNRITIVEFVIKVKQARKDKDVNIWEWILDLLHFLKADGMSSDESDVEGGNVVFQVKIVPWRREGVAEIMDLIDAQKLTNAKTWRQQGAKPVPRLPRNVTKLISTRRHVDDLPRALYNAEWLSVPANSVVVQVSKEAFGWVEVLARNN